MSKRNFILLIIILIAIIFGVLGYFYFNQSVSPAGIVTSGTNFIAQFNPFANIKTAPPKETPPADISGYQPNPTVETSVKLKKVSSMPIAGYITYSKERLKAVPVVITPPTDTSSGSTPDTTTPPVTPPIKAKTLAPTAPLTEFAPSLRYVDRTNGNIYQTFADKIEERKFSTTVIPKVYEASFGNKGVSIIMRYLKDDNRTIQTFVGNLPKEYLGADSSATSEVTGSFLPENITDLSISPDTSSVFYLFNTGDNLIGTTLNLTNNKKVQIFNSAFTEWLSWWPNSKMITLTTKPSSRVPGYMYAMDSSGKNFSKTLGPINGLTTLTSPGGKLVLYSDDNLSLNIFHTDTKVSNTLGLKTLPEKCVWNSLSTIIYCAVPKSISAGSYPDTWYQGVISFSDQIWKVDVTTGNATLIVDPITISGGEDVDGIKLAIDDGENYLFFVNKKDSFLWEFNLK